MPNLTTVPATPENNDKEQKKNPVKQRSKEKVVLKPMTTEQVMKLIKDCAIASCDPKMIVQAVGKAAMEYTNNPKTKGAMEKVNAEIGKGLPLIALDTHYLAAEVVGERFRPFVIQLAQQLTAEYQCKTPSEKMLAENVALAYGRVLELSRTVMSSTRTEYLSHEKNSFYGVLSKELDRAQRQLTSSLLVLKQMKSPTMEINVKAKTAFIAQNQQVNANGFESKKQEPPVYENNTHT